MEEKKGKKSGLGRGLMAILGGNEMLTPDGNLVNSSGILPNTISEISVNQIETNPYQPRNDFDQEALAELSDSIKIHGIIQPITVRKLNEQTYQLISGERRLQASKIAGLETIPAYIRTANDEQMIEMALIENIQRQDLNPIEIALGYQRLMEECNLILEDLGHRVGKKRATVNNYLRLLKLPPEIQQSLKQGKISMGHARALITIDNPIHQFSIYQKVIQQDLSVRQVEEFVRNLNQPKTTSTKTNNSPQDVHIRDIQSRLGKHLNTKVQINQQNDGNGEIRLKYYSLDELNRLIDILERD
ncbi:MAG: ParB/RepB/Spo0J family partition protein [Bacteroidia bacterium]|nr:ParB/RepB/Spo0J family partition protein [Bacteroidia bacterium]